MGFGYALSKKQEKQTTVRVPKPMLEAVADFLETNEAKRLGLDSKSDVVTAALRELLEKYEFIKTKKR